MSFTGFPDEGLVFYEGLEADNSKSYWTQHKAVYDEHVRGPMLALVAELTEEFGTAKLFRPYRDVRFAKDKTPYKDHQGAVLHPSGEGPGAWYVEVSADGLRAAGGAWRLQPDQVERYRRAVDDGVQGPRLQEIADGLAAHGHRPGRAAPGAQPPRLRRRPPAHRRCCATGPCTAAGTGRRRTGWVRPPSWTASGRPGARSSRSTSGWADNVGASTAPPDRRR